jgi:hypothetical protein
MAGAGATAVGADTLPNPWFGSDTVGDLVKHAISVDGNLGAALSVDYVPGGSTAGQAFMLANGASGPTQQATPMSKMMTSSANLCGTAGTSGSGAVNASGIVIGLDAVDILSGTASGSNAGVCASASPANGGAHIDNNTGLAANNSTIWGAGGSASNSVQNWKWVLALVYGGLDYSTGITDCSQTSRANLVNNWGNLFQNTTCSNIAPNSVCSDSAHTSGAGVAAGTTPLWHAFRRDDASGTSDVFSNLIGITTKAAGTVPSGAIGGVAAGMAVAYPGTSSLNLNGFGASPYCNALNWDSNVNNNNVVANQANMGTAPAGAGCLPALAHDQFVGPGGVQDPNSQCNFVGFSSTASSISATTYNTCSLPACTTPGQANCGSHRMPPPGTWGTLPVGSFTGEPAGNRIAAFDVLPTEFQDNDPIRRTCLGSVVGVSGHAAEEVCNLDGKLGLVLSMPASDFIPTPGSGATTAPNPQQYPNAVWQSFGITSKAVATHSCAPFNTRFHDGECPDGDTTASGTCQAPLNGAIGSGTTQVQVGVGDLPLSITARPTFTGNTPPSTADGRVYNLFMYDGTNVDTNVGFMKESLQTFTLSGAGLGATAANIDFAGGIYRIHQVATIWDGAHPATQVGCQLRDMTDNIGCLVNADPCSIGYAGDGGRSWNTSPNDVNPAGQPAGTLTDAVRVYGVYPATTDVQASGLKTAYPMARKLYYNSFVGFGNIANTATDSNTAGELDIANFFSIGGVNKGGTTVAINSGTNSDTINAALTTYGFFNIASTGTQGNPAGNNAQFCEDFNERLICKAASNTQNGCGTNPTTVVGETATAIPAAGTKEANSTVCGDGTTSVFEECDPGTAASGAGTATCSQTCRCAGLNILNQTGTGACTVN